MERPHILKKLTPMALLLLVGLPLMGDTSCASGSASSSSASSENPSLPPCNEPHYDDGAGIPCIDPASGETTDFYDYKQRASQAAIDRT